MKKYLHYWILIFLLPILLHGLDWPSLVVEEVDHCSIALCDFVRHYLPQSQMIRDGQPTIVGGWFYPPLLAMMLVPLT